MAARKEELIRESEADIDKEREQHQGHTHDVVRQMTGQYRSMESDRQKTIAEMAKRYAEQEEKKRELKTEISDLLTAKEKMINDKDAEIRKYKERIDEMSSDFAQILKSCLEKMSERIDFGNQTYEGNLEGG